MQDIEKEFQKILEMENETEIINHLKNIPIIKLEKYRNKLFWEAVTANLKYYKKEINQKEKDDAWMKYHYMCEVIDIRLS